MLLVGVVEDNLLFLISNILRIGFCTHTTLLAYPQGITLCPIKSVQPVLEVVNHLLSFLVDPLILFSVLAFIGVLTSGLMAFRIYSRVFPRSISVALSLVFLLSPYFAYHARSHVELVYVGLVLLVLYPFIFGLFDMSRGRALVHGFLLALTIGVSNYLGYFALLLIVPLGVARFFTLPKGNRGPFFRFTLLFGTSASILSAFFLLPYLLTYLSVYFPGLKSIMSLRMPAFGAIHRTIEDFFVFSSRPWYFLLPSPENPFIGSLAPGFVAFLQDSLHLWWASNYFPSEHSASFLGWFNLALGLVGLFVFVKSRLPLDKVTRSVLGGALVVLCFLVPVMMPPFVTVHGHKVFFPSFVLFKLFPMFRVLARLGVFALFFWLFFVGLGLTYLQSRLKPFWFRFVFGFWFVGNLLTMFVPLRFTYVGSPPQVFTYLASSSQPQDALAVYPFKMALPTTFWIRAYKRSLINPRGVYVSADGTQNFTASLVTTAGLARAQRLGTRYLVYFPLADPSRLSTIRFFDASPVLRKVGVFDPGESHSSFLSGLCSATHICRYVSYGSSPENLAVLYEFVPVTGE